MRLSKVTLNRPSDVLWYIIVEHVEHSTSLCKVYADNMETFQQVFSEKSLRGKSSSGVFVLGNITFLHVRVKI